MCFYLKFITVYRAAVLQALAFLPLIGSLSFNVVDKTLESRVQYLAIFYVWKEGYIHDFGIQLTDPVELF